MTSPLAEVVKGWKALTLEEIDFAKKTPGLMFDERDFSILRILKNIPPKDKYAFYNSFRVKPEYQGHFEATVQGPWFLFHEYFLGYDLDRKHEDASHQAIVMREAEEILSNDGNSENVRCKLFYAMKYPSHIEFKREDIGEVQLRSLRELYDFVSGNGNLD